MNDVVKNESFPINFLEDLVRFSLSDADEWDYPIPADINASIAYVLEEFTLRERDCVLSYYRDGMTYREIAKKYNVVHERIRQIIAHVMRRIRHPSRIVYLKYGVNGLIDKARTQGHEAALSSRFEKTTDEIYDILKQLKKDTPVNLPQKSSERTVLELTLEELELSVRSYNVLHRAGIKTVGDLVKKSSAEIITLRNMGNKSFAEIKERLHNFGQCFADETVDETGD